ncbi:MAG: amino acid ABC transporter permease [Actinomycetota bacterium]|nr:MAG: amino acid ABC transporter permease [Actinomycetota bacterium]
MQRRLYRSVALFAAALALAVTALTPVALGQETTASPAPGTPVVTGVIPNPDDPKGVSTWTGTQVIVNYEPNGAELAYDQCQLFINGQEQELIRPPSEVPAISRATSGIQFKWDTRYEKGDYDFRVLLVTMTGETVEYEWSFASEGRAGAGQLFSFDVMRTWFRFIAEGAINTVALTVISIVLASILALLGALGRLSKKMTFKQAWERYGSWAYMWRMALGRIPYLVATFYTSLFRGTPLLLQIIFIYQVTPEIIQRFGFSPEYNPPAFWAGVAALSLNYGAYLTEVFRAGIQAVPKGQTEAAWALGLSGWQTQRRIILPQAFKIVIPAVGNDFIALIKDTSLVSVITVEELLRRAQLAGAATFNFLSTLVVAAAFYWALTIFFSFWQAKLERRMERDKARE